MSRLINLIELIQNQGSPPLEKRLTLRDGTSIALRDWQPKLKSSRSSATNGLPIICVHGLTRNSRDFDWLARHLRQRSITQSSQSLERPFFPIAARRVIAVDIVGRGNSSWLKDPHLYNYPTYCSHMIEVLDQLQLPQVDWVGTSMGGAIGMMIAGNFSERIRALVLNDMGGMIPAAAMKRIIANVSVEMEFATYGEAVARVKQLMITFGELSWLQWRQMTDHLIRPKAGGGWRLHYDPAIKESLIGADQNDIELWSIWAKVKQPTLILRGKDSDLLLPKVAERMAKRKGVTLVEINRVGHAPTLVSRRETTIIRNWLAPF